MSDEDYTALLLRTMLWALVCVVASLLFSIAGIVWGLSILPSGEADKIVLALLERRALGRGVTLFMVVPSIVMLTVAGKVTGEAALAALSAIAGYMLASAGNQ